MDELKPCPFCGGNAKVCGLKGVFVMCESCKAETQLYYDDRYDIKYRDTAIEKAIKAWNRRVNSER